MNDSTNDSYDMMAHHSFPGDSGYWFVDSGVIDHMCCNKDSFTIDHSLDLSKPIYLGESSVVNAYGTGMIRIGDKVNLFRVNGKNLFISNYTSYCRGTDCPHCSLGVWEWPARTGIALSAARSSDRAS